MKVCVTGGSGFIGKHLVEKLIASNHEVTVIDIKKNDELNAKFKNTDLTNFKETSIALQNFDLVYHMAGSTLVSTVSDPISSIKSTLVGTANVLKSCVENSINKVIYASSASVYNGFSENDIVDETQVSHPFKTELFGALKITGERLVFEYAKKYDLKYVILRIGPVFNYENNCSSIIYNFLKAVIEKENLEIWGNGTRLLQPTYVKDIALGCVLASDFSNEIFNIIEPNRYSIIEIAKFLEKKFNLKYSLDQTKSSGQVYPNISAKKSIEELNLKYSGLFSNLEEIIYENSNHDKV